MKKALNFPTMEISSQTQILSDGKRVYQQAAAYLLMLNTGLRTGELLGLLNSDIDLEKKTLTVRQGVKEIIRRDGTKAEGGITIRVGKPKSASSKRTVPLNQTAVAMIEDLRKERCFGENTPLVCDENGDYTKPLNLRKRYYRILKAAGIERKGLHTLRHTFATNLVNGIRKADGSLKSLTPRQVADLLGHSTSQITELYYVKKDTSRLGGITDGFEL
jgi:integrase